MSSCSPGEAGTPLDELPDETTLQRAVVQHVQSGLYRCCLHALLPAAAARQNDGYAIVRPRQNAALRQLPLGPDRAANLLEVVSVVRKDGSEIVIHAMRTRAKYEPFLGGEGDSDA